MRSSLDRRSVKANRMGVLATLVAGLALAGPQVSAGPLVRGVPGADPARPAGLLAPLDPARPRNSLTLFGGAFTDAGLFPSYQLFRVGWEDIQVVAAAYRRDLLAFGRSGIVGAEFGFAERFGAEGPSSEVWAAGSVRFRLSVADRVIVAPGATLGFSLVDRPLGRARIGAAQRGADARLMAYLGPELGIALPQLPHLEVVYRLHHRSGAWGLFGGAVEGHNAHTLGLRLSF